MEGLGLQVGSVVVAVGSAVYVVIVTARHGLRGAHNGVREGEESPLHGLFVANQPTVTFVGLDDALVYHTFAGIGHPISGGGANHAFAVLQHGDLVEGPGIEETAIEAVAKIYGVGGDYEIGGGIISVDHAAVEDVEKQNDMDDGVQYHKRREELLKNIIFT